MPTRIIRSFADLDAMQGRTNHVLNLRQVLGQRTLQRPLDLMIGQDAQTMHAVTPVTPTELGTVAWRDVLVVAFTKVTT